MIPIINSQNEIEFELSLRRKFIYSPSAKIALISLFDGSLEDSLEIKLFMQDVYFRHYGAKIEITYPRLLAVLDKNNNILSAVGFRPASNQKLFLEQYLDGKIEDVVSQKYQKSVSRNQIVEVGSLASIGGGMSKFLFIALAAYLRNEGYLFTVMTGTHNLRKSFRKMGLKPIVLGEATKDRLVNKAEDWGSYYKTNPQVLAGNIESGYKVLKAFLGASIISSITKLYPYEQNL